MDIDILQAIKECPMVKNMPTGVSELLKELSKEDTEVEQLIRLLEKFPVVCIRLVMVANSAWAAPKTEITDVKRACMQIGLKMVKSISIALLVSQQFNANNCKGFSERKFWLSSLVTADLMQSLQKLTEPHNSEPSTAHLIGLIHNLGLLAIADIAPEKVSQALILSNNAEIGFSVALNKVLGISYLEATQIILQNWGLPETLSNSFYASNNESDYRAMLFDAIQTRNLLDLDVLPIEIIEENEQHVRLQKEVIEKSTVYDDLCGMYCR